VDGRVIKIDDQPILVAGPGSRCRVIASARNGATRISVVERWLEPSAEVLLHRHPEGVEEVVWVRAGEAAFRVEDETVVVGPGTTIVIPPLAQHGFRSQGSVDLYLVSRYSAPVPVTLGEDGSEGAPEVPGT
jgi:mannose-6-phosphate isomerase-like protein (cupin superfamily)